MNYEPLKTKPLIKIFGPVMDEVSNFEDWISRIFVIYTGHPVC
jgi:hypothetical protein